MNPFIFPLSLDSSSLLSLSSLYITDHCLLAIVQSPRDTKFTFIFSEDHVGHRNPSTEDMADAARTFTVILNWGILRRLRLACIQMVPELARGFLLRVFKRFKRHKKHKVIILINLCLSI
jgi:hypothetical protein